MKQKTLILLCDNYPLSAREFFIDDEMRVIAPKFDKVLIYTASADSGENLNRFVPTNAEIVSFSRQKLESGKLKSVFRIFKPMLMAELFFALRGLPVKQWLSAIKIMYVEIHRATNLKEDLVGLCKAKNLNPSDCVFYSYWHDYKALALAMLRKDDKSIKCIARAHRWDVFADKNLIPYLPFKSFIINNLSQTYSISDAGKIYFEQYLNCKLDDKVTVSRLGKFNDRQPNMDKPSDSVLICSCSNLIPVKRVDKIIEVISLLQTKNIRWVHFGDGSLRANLEAMATNKLQNVEFEFRGIVANNKILDFYAENHVDLFINLSASEGIPVSIMEALSAGIPVLATSVGGTAEAVNSKNGFLIPADFDSHNVAQIIDNYLNAPIPEQNVYRQNAYDFWQENYEAGKNYNDFI
ncbi:MAG: glycosyltransferase [Bacteroidales bacterium]|nr:glycosyltransferase [Salinivirgaceae bacterium]MBR7034642.1 glycosyltransferase [Bacteroidales bacterium]